MTRMNWTATNKRRRIRDQGAETVNGAARGGNAPAPRPERPPPDQQPARGRPSLPEPIEWRLWKNRLRRDAVVVSLSTYENRNLIGIRLHTTSPDGRMLPTAKGVSLVIARLPELHTALTRALAKARALGLIDGQDETSEAAE
jgi:hypothetical protein